MSGMRLVWDDPIDLIEVGIDWLEHPPNGGDMKDKYAMIDGWIKRLKAIRDDNKAMESIDILV